MYKNKKQCVVDRLRATFGADRVHNLAADGFKSIDVLEGAKPCISFHGRKEHGDPFPGMGENLSVFKPLEVLKTLSPPPTHVILSVGGNDIREILGNIGKLPEVI
jgi:hypothetical protein